MADTEHLRAAFVARLNRVEQRLTERGARWPGDGLTPPDAATGEQWDAGQVWAHLIEIVPYWHGEVLELLVDPEPQPKPFGRIKSDPGRIAAVEEARHEDIQILLLLTLDAISGVRQFLATFPASAWELRGLHAGQGEMTMERIVDFFIVGHLEEHADQLDILAAGGAKPAATT